MKVSFLMDVHVPFAVTKALRLRGIDVLTAQEDDAAELDDLSLLRRATELSRMLVTQDRDLLREGDECLERQELFFGVVYSHRIRVPVGRMIADLALMGEASTAGEWINVVAHLPI